MVTLRNTKSKSTEESSKSKEESSVTLERIISKIKLVANTLTSKSKKKDDLNPKEITSCLEHIKDAFEDLTEYLDEEKKSKSALENKVDIEIQKNYKGHFVVSSTDKSHPLKSAKDVKEDKNILIEHVQELADKKYSVKIPKEEFVSCFHLNNGNIAISLAHHKKDSAFHKLVEKIKMKPSNKLNIFFNFRLTGVRSYLLFEIRKLKRDGEISKYYTDENGQISIKTNDDKKIKVTNFYDKEEKDTRCLTLQEMKEYIK